MNHVERENIEAMVRRVVTNILGVGHSSKSNRVVIDAEMVNEMPASSSQTIPANALVTPLARQAAMERHIQLKTTGEEIKTVTGSVNAGNQIIALGADHGGYNLKNQLKQSVEALGYQTIDCGTNSPDSVDYPDYAYAVAQLVANGKAWRGIIIDGAGIGSCMTANKVPGVLAAMCYDQATASNSREHNNANVLTLGAGLIGVNLAKQIVETWLKTEFGGGRHQRRVQKITAIEKRFLKK